MYMSGLKHFYNGLFCIGVKPFVHVYQNINNPKQGVYLLYVNMPGCIMS